MDLPIKHPLMKRRTLTILLATLILVAIVAGGRMEQTRFRVSAAQDKSSAPRSAGGPTQPEREKHFSPEIEKFVETFRPGGEGVEGAGGVQAPSPEESLRLFTVSKGLQMEVIASEPTIRQPLNLHFE